MAVTLLNTEVLSIYSNYVKDDFKLSVAYPKAYDVRKSYPIIFLLDANVFFGLFTDTIRLLQASKEVEDVIVVGVGYHEKHEHLYIRNRDLAPSPYDMPEVAGHAKDFLRFLEKELMPYVENKWHVEKENYTLVGDSMGGLFALYCLFNKGSLFSKYIIGSPSMYWDEGLIFNYEAEHFKRSQKIEARVFLSVGALEAIYEPAFARMVGNVEDLVEIFKRRNYKGLSLKHHIFENETHMSVIPATFSRGLREVFNERDKGNM